MSNLIPKGLDRNQIICLMKFGSHLYGTNGPDSDVDYKGVYLPSKRQVLLGNIPKSYSIRPVKKEGEKNSKDDVDIEIYSLHYFLKLAREGQTVAIDMLHADLTWCDIAHPIWADLLHDRNKFYTKNLNAFVGYARRQAAKYGIKGSRLNAAKEVLDFLEPLLQGPTDPGKLLHHWNSLPEGEHIHKFSPVLPQTNPFFVGGTMPVKIYQVCGKQIQATVSCQYAYNIVKKFYDEYGARAQAAANNEGIDWKAVSHALRAAYEVECILSYGTFTFPLNCWYFLKAVKNGKVGWGLVQDILEDRIKKIEELAKESNLPDKVNWKRWENWLVRVMETHAL